MKQNFLKKITDMLISQKTEILSKSSQVNDIDPAGDEVDQIQAKILANVENQLSLRQKSKLKNIENALEKIANGNFGLCEECGEKIAEKRLIFNPVFINCIACAEQLEMEERRNRKN